MTKARKLEVTQSKKDSPERTIAKAVLEPAIGGAVTVADYSQAFGDNVELSELMMVFRDQIDKLEKNDLGRAESMLLVQAHTLDSIFNNLARRAINAEYMSSLESYLKLGLKAQSQCRATLDSLVKMKNPSPVQFVAQANIAHGHQQVNNAVGGDEGQKPKADNPTDKNQKTPNELLTKGEDNAAPMDTSPKTGTSQKDKELATVATRNRR